jgi:hypothetical protein
VTGIGIAASEATGIAASEATGIAASEVTGIAASEVTGIAATGVMAGGRIGTRTGVTGTGVETSAEAMIAAETIAVETIAAASSPSASLRLRRAHRPHRLRSPLRLPPATSPPHLLPRTAGVGRAPAAAAARAEHRPGDPSAGSCVRQAALQASTTGGDWPNGRGID